MPITKDDIDDLDLDRLDDMTLDELLGNIKDTRNQISTNVPRDVDRSSQDVTPRDVVRS